jgi:hypothetical protein
MRIRYLDGLTSETQVESEMGAREIILDKFPLAFFGEMEEMGDQIRRPVWEDEESSIDDSGEGAVAYIDYEEVA